MVMYIDMLLIGEQVKRARGGQLKMGYMFDIYVSDHAQLLHKTIMT